MRRRSSTIDPGSAPSRRPVASASDPSGRPANGSGEGSDAPPGLRAAVGRPRGTGAQLVFERLRERILSLDLSPLAELDESQLVAEFELSRTPVREALIRLSSEGLVDLPPNKTPRVAALDLKDVPALLEALELAQRAVNRWAAFARTDRHIDEIAVWHGAFREATDARDATAMSDANRSFHRAIAAACGNPWLAGWYGTLLNGSMRLARLMFNTAPVYGEAYLDYYNQIVAEHGLMLDAIAGRDAESAERVGRDHAHLFRGEVRRFLMRSRCDEVRLD